MIKKTSGIVLNTLKYQESSIITKIFTRELGLKSYVVNGVRSQGKSTKMALYQPMTKLDLVVYDKANSGLQRISDAKIEFPTQRIPFDFSRISIAMFMAEMINRSIYDNYQNEWLFDFLSLSIELLDEEECPLPYFPILFLIQQAKFLGFSPAEAMGFFEESQHQTLSIEELNYCIPFLEDALSNGYQASTKISSSVRRKLLNHMLDFYREHLDNPTPIKSLPVLRQIME